MLKKKSKAPDLLESNAIDAAESRTLVIGAHAGSSTPSSSTNNPPPAHPRKLNVKHPLQHFSCGGTIPTTEPRTTSPFPPPTTTTRFSIPPPPHLLLPPGTNWSDITDRLTYLADNRPRLKDPSPAYLRPLRYTPFPTRFTCGATCPALALSTSTDSDVLFCARFPASHFRLRQPSDPEEAQLSPAYYRPALVPLLEPLCASSVFGGTFSSTPARVSLVEFRRRPTTRHARLPASSPHERTTTSSPGLAEDQQAPPPSPAPLSFRPSPSFYTFSGPSETDTTSRPDSIADGATTSAIAFRADSLTEHPFASNSILQPASLPPGSRAVKRAYSRRQVPRIGGNKAWLHEGHTARQGYQHSLPGVPAHFLAVTPSHHPHPVLDPPS
ncbi:hypothetical protein VDGL01_05280 [Verticillium dahliae]